MTNVSNFVDNKLRPLAVDPREMIDPENIYVEPSAEFVLIEIGKTRVYLTKKGAKELATRLIEIV